MRDESPPRKTVNSIALSAPMATLRNLASHPECPAHNNQPSMSRVNTPEPNPELPPSVISSFDPIKRGIITVEEANKLFTMSVDMSPSPTSRLIGRLLDTLTTTTLLRHSCAPGHSGKRCTSGVRAFFSLCLSVVSELDTGTSKTTSASY